MAQGTVGPAQAYLQIGHHQGIANGISFELRGRAVKPVSQNCPQRPAFFLLGTRVEITENRCQDLAPFFDLLQ